MRGLRQVVAAGDPGRVRPMCRQGGTPSQRWHWLSIAAALALLAALAVWNFVDEWRSLRHRLLVEEVRCLEARGVRLAGWIERELEIVGGAALSDVADRLVQDPAWGWAAVDPERHMYAALVDLQGAVVAHSDPRQRGQRLGREWYEAVASDLGAEVVHTRSAALTSGRQALDVHVPILWRGEDVGSFHLGLSQRWFDGSSAAARRRMLWPRSLWWGAVLLAAGVAGASLHWLAERSATLEEAVARTYTQAASELGQLAAGLAHEIRNPLHALRLNLHAFRRIQEDRSALSPEEISRMLEQSVGEIDRIDRLLQELISFATPVEPRDETIDLNKELENLVDFVGQELLRSNVEIQLTLPEQPAGVRMDHARLRQVVLNLLHNARDAMPEGGRVEIDLARRDGWLELTISDRGRGIAESDMPRIFEPFFTTSERGVGLGLALVKRFVLEAGGQIYCESPPQQGTRFLIRLREISMANARTGASA